jgi:AcrR family transcriptional regulator
MIIEGPRHGGDPAQDVDGKQISATQIATATLRVRHPRYSILAYSSPDPKRGRKRHGAVDSQGLKCNDCYITIRDRLLHKCLAYFLRHGVAHLSLRPLAGAIGTSARMLLHYFGSKEMLIAEVMERVHVRLQATFQELLDRSNNNAGQHFLLEFWSALAAKANRPALRLLFEVQVLALQNPKRYRRYLTHASGSWRELIERALPPGRASAEAATLYNAVIDGLLLELLSTGQQRRTSQALRIFIDKCAPIEKPRRKARS